MKALGRDQGSGWTRKWRHQAVPVDENLFTGEDLDEQELNTLDLKE